MKTQYDAWLEAEKSKIHAEFEEKRQQIEGKAFIAGMEGKNKSDNELKVLSAEYEALNQQEQEAVAEFLRQIKSE